MPSLSGANMVFVRTCLCLFLLATFASATFVKPLQDERAQLVVANVGLGAPAPTGGAQVWASAGAQPAATSGHLSDELIRFEEFRASSLYVPPFDPKVISIPGPQLAFVRNMTANDIVLFKSILDEAVAKRDKFAASVSLMLKYTGKILGQFIRNRRNELAIYPRLEPRLEFFKMLADMAQRILDKSDAIKRHKGYTKANVDMDSFHRRVDSVFSYVQRVVDVSPVGAYLKWDEMRLFKDEPRNPLYLANFVDEAADLTAVSLAGFSPSAPILLGRLRAPTNQPNVNLFVRALV